jgi:hypothetical protein
MVLVDHVCKIGDTYYYRFFLNNKIEIVSFEGGQDAYISKLDETRNLILISLFEDFLSYINKDFPAENKIQSYNEAKSRIRDYIVWALENQHLKEEILKFAIKSLKRAQIIMQDIPDSYENKKVLYFLLQCVTLTANHRITLP